MEKTLFEIKDKKKNIDFVEEVKNRWSKLKDSTKKAPREEQILEIVKDILNFNKQNQQKGQGIKILTPNQMFNRLPIALAQLQEGNNSNKWQSHFHSHSYFDFDFIFIFIFFIVMVIITIPIIIMETIFMNTENSKKKWTTQI